MNRFYIRLYNSLGCEIDVVVVDVPEGRDCGLKLRAGLSQLLKRMMPEPGDTIRIEEP